MTRCTAQTRSGRPCRNQSRRGSDPPRCFNHAADPALPEHLQSALAARPPEPSGALRAAEVERATTLRWLDEEIAGVRATQLALRKSAQAGRQPDAHLLTRLAPQIFAGARTISRLLLDRQKLTEQPVRENENEISAALDEIRRELGWDV